MKNLIDSTVVVLHNSNTQQKTGCLVGVRLNTKVEKENHRIPCGFFVSMLALNGQAVRAFFGMAVSLVTVRQPEQSLLTHIGVWVSGFIKKTKEKIMKEFCKDFGKKSYYATPASKDYRPTLSDLTQRRAIDWLLTTLTLVGHDVSACIVELSAYQKLAKKVRREGGAL